MTADPGDQPSDEALLREGRSGSKAAPVALYERYRPRIVGFALRMTGDFDLAEDVFAAAFAAFLDVLERQSPIQRLKPYLFRIARTKLLDELAARERLGTSLPAKKEWLLARSSGAQTPPSETAEIHEQSEGLHRALADLPDHLREVVLLRIFDDLDYAAIGEIVGAGETTIRSRMRYALQALRRGLS